MAPPFPHTPAPRPRVLVIDDQADAADSLDLLLVQLGCDTSVAYGALEGLQQAPAFQPDVVMLDLHMPRINGLDAARALRACRLDSHPLLVALTSDTRASMRDDCLAAGFDLHLVKPTAPGAISAVLDTLLASRARTPAGASPPGDPRGAGRQEHALPQPRTSPGAPHADGPDPRGAQHRP